MDEQQALVFLRERGFIVLTREEARWLRSEADGAFSALWLRAFEHPNGGEEGVEERRQRALALLTPDPKEQP